MKTEFCQELSKDYKRLQDQKSKTVGLSVELRVLRALGLFIFLSIIYLKVRVT